MAVQKAFYFLVYFLINCLIPVVRLQGYFGWTSSDGGHCWSNAGVTCSLRPSGCGPNQVNNPWRVGCNPEANITLNRPTAQTNTASGQPSNRGVDGDVNTCASTTTVTNPAWLVDLPGLHVVHGIRFKGGVYVNGACSNTQIAIKVEGIAQGVAVNGTVCARLSGTASCNSMETINCGSVEKPGNRLLIDYPGTGQLRVCELEIIGYQYPYNLAYGKPVMQDGVNDKRYAYYAVDGQLGTSQPKPDCTQTGLNKHKPWWWVDLGSQNVVYSVRLLNIENYEYYFRLKNFTIYVGDKNVVAEFSSNAVCYTHDSTSVGAAVSVEFQCQNGPLLGRYVIIQLNVDGGYAAYLQLCEVMVKGYKAKACPQRYGPDCSRQCDCQAQHVYTCHYITGTCCGQYKKGYRCEQDLPKLTNAPVKESRTDTSIKVKWDAWNTNTGSGSATVVKYELKRQNDMAIDTGQATDRNVTGLGKDTQYCFSVVVLDENNWRGEPSAESCFRTCSDPKDTNIGVTANLGSETKSNIVITWNTPDYNCDSGRFELRVQKGIIDCDKMSGTPLNTGSAPPFTVSNKIPYTNYTVKFTLINNIGLKRDMCKTIQTPEGVPPSPVNARILSVSSTSLNITWGKPDPPHGIITSYEIRYSSKGGLEMRSIRTVNPDRNSGTKTEEIQNLIPNTEYYVKVRGSTRLGHSSWSEELHAVTAEGIPEEPENLRNTSKGQKYIVLQWNAPSKTNGQITVYEVSCDPGNIVKVVLGGLTSLNITGLSPSTLYSCKVKATTSAGFGKESKPVHVWTTPKIELPTNKSSTKYLLGKSETSMTVKLFKIPGVDLYRIVVENATENARSRRDATGDFLFPAAKVQHLKGYFEAKRSGITYYITAEITSPPDIFTVGDGKEYGGYGNQELMPGESYNIYYGGKKTTDGVPAESYLLIVKAEIAESSVPKEVGSSDGAVVGGVLGCFALLIIVIIAFVFVLRRKELGPFAAKDNTDNVHTENNTDLRLANLSQINVNRDDGYEEIQPASGRHVGESSYTELSGHTNTAAAEALYCNVDNGASGLYVNGMVRTGPRKTKK